MNKTKVRTLILSLDKTLRELAKETDTAHISAFIIDNKVSIDDYADIDNPKFNYYNNGTGGVLNYE